MSDNWLTFIPVEPRFRPTADDAERARQLFASFVPDAQEVNAQFTDEIRFVDCGENLQSVLCPACHQDIQTWWAEAMDAASLSCFEHLDVVTPCCGVNTTLDRLHYDWPAGFGRFVLEAMNPNVRDISAEQAAALADAIGSPLRKIWVHL